MRDGGLRDLFQKHLTQAMWVPIETWSTGQGVPDAHYSFADGTMGWVEFKQTSAWSVGIEREQSAWLERYARYGGRAFIAVRRQATAGMRKKAADELWLWHGCDARVLMVDGLRSLNILPLGCWQGGPARWDWGAVMLGLKT